MRSIEIKDTDPTLAATRSYLRRHCGLDSPEGQFDNGRLWYPSGKDKEVMAPVRSPSAAFPLSYLSACKSIKHCAALHGADTKEVRRLTRKIYAEFSAKQLSTYAPMSEILESCIERFSSAAHINQPTPRATAEVDAGRQ